MHGGSDPMTAPSGSQYLYQNIASSDKTLKVYDGLMHEIFNEPEAMDIYKEVVSWLDKRSVTSAWGVSKERLSMIRIGADQDKLIVDNDRNSVHPIRRV